MLEHSENITEAVFWIRFVFSLGTLILNGKSSTTLDLA